MKGTVLLAGIEGKSKMKKTILIVEDNRLARKKLRQVLQEDYDILEACNGKAGLKELEKNREKIFLIILDLIMPEMDGLEFLQEYQRREWETIPIIVSTADDMEEMEQECLELGVWDFISKYVSPEILKWRIHNAIKNRWNQSLEYDSLTKIYTEKQFFRVTSEMLLSNPEKKYVFIRFDIDRFKMINSFYGIEEGDNVLRYIGDMMKKSLSGMVDCTFGRINGDIFGVCINRELVNAVFLVERFAKKIKAYMESYFIQPSFGIYEIEDNTLDIKMICDRAQLAASLCKGSYDKIYAFYDSCLNDRLLLEQKILSGMDKAIENGEFHVYYQPKVSMKTGQLYGAEALVRWIKRDGTVVSNPAEFVPILEKNGFIIPMDYYVWEKVCKFIQKSLRLKERAVPVAVNVSRVHFYDPNFIPDLLAILKKYEVQPSYLNLEITESVFIDDEHVALEVIRQLKSYGFHVFMDDFGSAYSSLNILKDFPFDVLKIDMKFISDGNAEKGNIIVDSVVKMAENLHLETIMEGVETEEQVRWVQSVRADFIQGFYFAKPMPEEAYEQFLTEHFQMMEMEDTDSGNRDCIDAE